MSKKIGFILAGKSVDGGSNWLQVPNKFTGEIVYEVALAGEKAIDEAFKRAHEARGAMAALKAYQRREVLQFVAQEMRAQLELFAQTICLENGKPIRDARGEVTRAIITLDVAAEEATRLPGEVLDLADHPRSAAYLGIVRYFPIGVVSMISPFNFPLSLAVHKVAPALAAGCPFVLKPASRTPVSALLLGAILQRAPHLPPAAFSILPCSRDGADLFTTHDLAALVSFTGSPEIGWALKARAGKKKLVLELGGNAACIIDAGADLDDVVARVVHGAFYQSGQSCISVQRVYAHSSLYARFRDALCAAVGKLVHGDPRDEATFVGPMIAEAEAVRLEEWLAEAVKAGAKVLVGGKRKGAMLDATVVEGAPRECKLYAQEAFGPVVVIEPFEDFDAALKAVNDSRFGLQAGVFCSDMEKCWRAFETLECGGVVINDVPSMRVDRQPYGGVKDSGLGREGPKYAMLDMLEPRIMSIRRKEQH